VGYRCHLFIGKLWRVSGDVGACPSARDIHKERRLRPAVLLLAPPTQLWVNQEAAESGRALAPTSQPFTPKSNLT